MTKTYGLALLVLLFICTRLQAQALQETTRQAGVEQRLGVQAPFDVELIDESGNAVALQHFFGDRPVILVLGYFRCPRLCSVVLNELLESLRGNPLTAGKDFTILAVSFDPKDTPELAGAKKKAYVEQYARPGAEAGWHFLTGGESEVKRLADAVGFHYYFDPAKGDYAHASAIIILTPDGKVSRYFLGLDFPSRDLRLALVEAGEGRIGSPTDQLMLLCLSYDPVTGRYRMTAMNAIRLGGAATVLLMAGALVLAWRRERTMLRAQRKPEGPGA